MAFREWLVAFLVRRDSLPAAVIPFWTDWLKGVDRILE
jgi:hypothetical protein